MKQIVAIFLFTVFLLLFPPVYGKTQARTYSFGVVPQFDVRRIQNIWDPILKTVSQKTGIDIRLVASSSIPEFEKSFEKGEFDMAYMNPYHLLVASEHQNYLPILRDQEHKLYGIIVVRNDSPIQNVLDLNGKTIAFPAPNALGAALIPRAEFSEKFKIRYTAKYVRSHTSVYLNVILRQSDAGGGVQNTFFQQKPMIRDSLKIIYETTKVNPHPIVVHPRVPQKIAEKIRAAFITMENVEEERKLLRQIPIQKIGPAVLEDYLDLKNLNLEHYYVKSGSK